MPQWDALALQLQQRIQQAGYECVIVGGAVRDLLRGQTPVDYDLACSAPPEQLLTLLPSAHATGGPYGTVTVCRSDADGVHQYEITPFRAEEGYSDGRHPDHVRFGVSLQEDLARRDFTVNAIAWDGSRVIDPFGGQADLSARLIRTVGDPSRRFQEDGLRILRALRFASALSFALEPDTLAAAIRCRGALRSVSEPRIKSELQAALLGRAPQALDAFLTAGGLRWLGLYPPQTAAEDAAGFTLAPLAGTPCRMLLRWWAFLTLLDADKKHVCSRLGFSQAFYRDLVLLDAFFAAPADRVTLKRRAARGLPAPMKDILQTFCALDARFEADRSLWAQITQAHEPCTLDELALSGRDLLALGLRGPAVGRRLRLLQEAVLAEPSLNRAAALAALSQALDELEEG